MNLDLSTSLHAKCVKKRCLSEVARIPHVVRLCFYFTNDEFRSVDKVVGLIEIELAMYPTCFEASSLKSSKADIIQGRKNVLLGTRTASTGCTSALSREIAVTPPADFILRIFLCQAHCYAAP